MIIFLCIVCICFIICALYFNLNPKHKEYDLRDKNQMFEDQKWIEAVIMSCKKPNQLAMAEKLIRLFKKKYEKKIEHKEDIDYCLDQLNIVVNLRWDEILK